MSPTRMTRNAPTPSKNGAKISCRMYRSAMLVRMAPEDAKRQVKAGLKFCGFSRPSCHDLLFLPGGFTTSLLLLDRGKARLNIEISQCPKIIKADRAPRNRDARKAHWALCPRPPHPSPIRAGPRPLAAR